VVVAGDMNAHSKIWNPRAEKRRNTTFWEDIIEQHGLVIWNSEEVIRSGPNMDRISIIDLTLASPDVEMNCSLLRDESTGSDHEVICWELLGEEMTGGGKTMGWDISGWQTKGKDIQEKEKAERQRAKAEETFRNLLEQIPLPHDTSDVGQLEENAEGRQVAMIKTLNDYGIKRRWCVRSKR
jgi:hypothetical protein